jgi:putative endonuclease
LECMNRQHYVYIMSSLSGILYVGFTSDLKKRVFEHKNDIVEGFTKKYRCHKLVYYEVGDSIEGVLAREKQLKNWRREKKIWLIEKMNPNWKDLSESL